MNKSDIISKHRMTFDPTDKDNGSLYICVDPTVEPGTDVNLVIDKLRSADLWSSDAPKDVPDEHRKAYEEQLELVEIVAFRDADSPFLAARFDHEKYPSNESRWQQWLGILSQHYQRA